MDHTHSANRTAPVLVDASLSFFRALDFFGEALRRRHIRRNYGCMSVAQLRDIGLTPSDLEAALSLPLENSAEDALAKAAADEAAKW